MPIQRITPIEGIQQYITDRLEAMEKVVIRNLCYVGEACRNTAITSHKYNNQTKNLESSTGYVVVANGEVVQMSGFGESDEGAMNGREYAEKLAKEETKGYCLILVAGMSYAKFVSDKGLDVLDSAELAAKRLIPEMMKQLKF